MLSVSHLGREAQGPDLVDRAGPFSFLEVQGARLPGPCAWGLCGAPTLGFVFLVTWT